MERPTSAYSTETSRESWSHLTDILAGLMLLYIAKNTLERIGAACTAPGEARETLWLYSKDPLPIRCQVVEKATCWKGCYSSVHH